MVDFSKYITPNRSALQYDWMPAQNEAQTQQEIDERIRANQQQEELLRQQETGRGQRAAAEEAGKEKKYQTERSDKEKEAARQVFKEFTADLAAGNIRNAHAKLPFLKSMGFDVGMAGAAESPEFQLQVPEYMESRPEWDGMSYQEKSPEQPSRYQLSVPELNKISEGQLAPMFEAATQAIIPRYQPHASQLASSVLSMGKPTDESFKNYIELLRSVSPIWRTEMGTDATLTAAELTSGRTARGQERAEEGQTWQQLAYSADKANLTDKKEILANTVKAKSLLDKHNPQSDTMVIGLIARFTEKGVLTEGDIQRASGGVQSWFQQLKRYINEKTPELQGNLIGGMDADVRTNLKTLLDNVNKLTAEDMTTVRDSLLQAGVENPQDAQVANRFIRMNFPPQFWPSRGKPTGSTVSKKAGSVPHPAGDENIGGSVPLPDTLGEVGKTPDEIADELLAE